MNGREWTPVVEHRSDTVTEAAARALYDLLADTGRPPLNGAELPALWHWLAFLPRARQRDLGPDGHPTTGGFLPPMRDRRRMHAGGQIDIDAPLHVGEPLQRSTQVTRIENKAGRSGELTFVTVSAEITSTYGRVHERTDLVYRPAAPQASPSATPPPSGIAADRPAMADQWEIQQLVRPEPTLLFRFSALTYNAHRIHYDREYATRQEGYPGLVVHGPLQAVLLAYLAEQTSGGRAIRQFRYRASAPAFDTSDLVLVARRTRSDELELAAFSAGKRTMSAVAVSR